MLGKKKRPRQGAPVTFSPEVTTSLTRAEAARKAVYAVNAIGVGTLLFMTAVLLTAIVYECARVV